MDRKGASTKGARVYIPVLSAVLLFVFLLSFSIGRYGVPIWQVVKILIDAIIPDFIGKLTKTWTSEMAIVVINIRLPRVLMACLVGCCLSAAGAAYQGIFKNPMASPDILGASSGAAFGAALAILLGASSQGITFLAFCFSMVTVLLVLLIAKRAPGMRTVNLILAGIMISSLFSAGTSCIKLVADPTNQLPAITFWLMGSLSGVKLSDLFTAFLPMAIGLMPLLLLSWQINLLTLGDDEARALGVNINLVRLIVILSATLITASSISTAGMIGWVGLVIPHLCRKLVGGNYRVLMPSSMIAGAAFLLVTDNISRCLLTSEIPIGILTAFIGAPFFIYLITRKEKAL